MITEMPPEWRPAAEHGEVFQDGDQYLVALRVVNEKTGNTRWQYYVVQAFADVDGIRFVHADLSGILGCVEDFQDWSWDDFEYYIKLGNE